MKYFFNTFQWSIMQAVLTRLFCAVSVGALAACGSIPSDGPSISMIERGAEGKSQPAQYILVPVDQVVVNTMALKERPAPGTAANSPPAAAPGPGNVSTITPGVEQPGTTAIQKIAAGDVVGVSIYTSGGGLFGAGESGANGTEGAPGNSETRLPPQLVDSSGEITVPYAGRIPVVGYTSYEVENAIIKALKTMAYKLSVIVTIQERRGSDLVTVTGDVKFPGRIPEPMSGLRIVDAVTAAGGSTARDCETKIVILGATNIREFNYSDVVAIPSDNVLLESGDTVIVKTRPWSFTSLGATGQSLHPFPSQELSAEEALASVSGLNDDKANPEAVFIYRFESPALLRALGVTKAPTTPSGVPVIYQFNLRQPDGFFMARQFAMRDKDVIFVGNAGSIGIIKAMNIVGTLTSPAIAGLSATAGAATVVH